MSNAAVRDARAKAVNRSLRLEGVIRADQMLRSYQRLVSLQVEFPEIDSEGALMKLVKLRIATKAACAHPEGAAAGPEFPVNVFEVAPELATPPAPAKPKRKSKRKAQAELAI